MTLRLGDRVRLNSEGRDAVRWERVKHRHGTIARAHDHGNYSVLWDNKYSIDKWHETLLEKIEAQNN